MMLKVDLLLALIYMQCRTGTERLSWGHEPRRHAVHSGDSADRGLIVLSAYTSFAPIKLLDVQLFSS